MLKNIFSNYRNGAYIYLRTEYRGSISHVVKFVYRPKALEKSFRVMK